MESAERCSYINEHCAGDWKVNCGDVGSFGIEIRRENVVVTLVS